MPTIQNTDTYKAQVEAKAKAILSQLKQKDEQTVLDSESVWTACTCQKDNPVMQPARRFNFDTCPICGRSMYNRMKWSTALAMMRNVTDAIVTGKEHLPYNEVKVAYEYDYQKDAEREMKNFLRSGDRKLALKALLDQGVISLN